MARPVRILVCAFGPFPGVPVNPSARLALAIQRLRRPALADIDVSIEILPTQWAALTHLRAVLDARAPDAVLLMGVASRRRQLCLELRAVNQADARPDAAHRHAPARRLAASDMDALRTTARVAPLTAALRGAGLPVRSSRDAGHYLCNASYFTTLNWARGRDRRPPIMFLHLPGRGVAARSATQQRLTQGVADVITRLAAEAKARRA